MGYPPNVLVDRPVARVGVGIVEHRTDARILGDGGQEAHDGRAAKADVFALLAALLPGLDADFYLCGPAVFAAGLRAELTAHGVSDGRIHSESFSGGL